MNNVQKCDRYTNIPLSQTYRLKISLICWARSGDLMFFLWGTDKPIELSWVLNKRRDDGYNRHKFIDSINLLGS
jgi:hypothetical protein